MSFQQSCILRLTRSFSPEQLKDINSATGATCSMLWGWASHGLSRSIVCNHLTTFEDKLGLDLIGRLVVCTTEGNRRDRARAWQRTSSSVVLLDVAIACENHMLKGDHKSTKGMGFWHAMDLRLAHFQTLPLCDSVRACSE